MFNFNLRNLIGAKSRGQTIAKTKTNEIVLPRKSPSASINPDYTRNHLCIVAIMKNEAPYLNEWIDFHLLEGVSHFYLYDNGSTDHPETVLEPYRASVSIVSWQNFAAGLSVQNLAYAHAMTNFAEKFEWAAFLDIDEFIFGDEINNVATALERFRDCNAVRVKRYTFGPSGHLVRPETPVIQTYTYRIPDESTDTSVKSIVRPRYVTKILPHYPSVIGDEFSYVDAVDSAGVPDLRVNHYYTKSISEFEAKFSRGWPLRSVDTAYLHKKKKEKFDLNEFTHFDDRIIKISHIRQRRSAK